MIEELLPVFLSTASCIAMFLGALMAVRTVKKRKDAESALAIKLVEIHKRNSKESNSSITADGMDLELEKINKEISETIILLSKVESDLVSFKYRQKVKVNNAKRLRDNKYAKFLEEVNEALVVIDKKDKKMLLSALKQESELGKIRFLEKITKEALEHS